MRKLIDAEKLKAHILTLGCVNLSGHRMATLILNHIDALPDIGCARGQAQSGTQWCAEACAISEELARVKAGTMDHTDALEEYKRQVWELQEELERLKAEKGSTD